MDLPVEFLKLWSYWYPNLKIWQNKIAWIQAFLSLVEVNDMEHVKNK